VRVVTEPEGVGRIAQGRRGPEYLTNNQKVTISEGQRQIVVQLTRWIDPSRWGWYSGDTHIHAGGCAHYDNPTEGVSPETMIRHVRGEALSIGDVLSWGPRSAQWCRSCVDKLWEVKFPFIREHERAAALEAYDHARKAYDAIIGECEVA
jgi:hypothetical protein